jgi:hypothetical protein
MSSVRLKNFEITLLDRPPVSCSVNHAARRDVQPVHEFVNWLSLGDIKNCNRPSTMCKYIVYTTLSSYEFRFYVFYTIETTWLIYMWAYKTVRTFLRTCNKPQLIENKPTSLHRWAKHFYSSLHRWAKRFYSIFFRMRDDYIPANYDCFVDKSTIQNSVVSDSVHQIFTHLNLFIG